jgi:hypothetical protein
MKPIFSGMVLVTVLASFCGIRGRSASVTESEAITMAEWWYAAEVNAATAPLPQEDKQSRIAAKGNHKVAYVLGRDDIRSTRAGHEQPSAYIVTFEPSGFVVISGEDSLQPVLVYNAAGSCNWSGDPKTNYLAHYLGRSVARVVEQEHTQAAKHGAHANWAQFRDDIKNGRSAPTTSGATSGTKGANKDGVYVLLPTALWSQSYPYNQVSAAHNGGNDVPTGCVATAMAIKFRYHSWPRVGSGSHSYSDTEGSIQYSHSVNFGTETFNWDNMPTNSLTVDNSDVANLMYDCGVAVNTNYEMAGSAAWVFGDNPAFPINNHFRYRGTYVINAILPQENTPGMIYCIQCGVPVIVGTHDHCFVACGYRDTTAPYFYFNMGWDGGNNGWYDVDDIIPDSDLPLNGSLPYSTPDNYVYTDLNAGSFGNGDLQTPCLLLSSGLSAVPSGGILWLKSGNYGNAGITITKPMTMNSYFGAATIGQ